MHDWHLYIASHYFEDPRAGLARMAERKLKALDIRNCRIIQLVDVLIFPSSRSYIFHINGDVGDIMCLRLESNVKIILAPDDYKPKCPLPHIRIDNNYFQKAIEEMNRDG